MRYAPLVLVLTAVVGVSVVEAIRDPQHCFLLWGAGGFSGRLSIVNI